LQDFLEVLPTSGDIGHIAEFLHQKPVKKDIREIMKLTPGAPEIKKPVPAREKGPVESDAVAYPQREKEKKTGRDDSGVNDKDPAA
jgi:hypothetical protein